MTTQELLTSKDSFTISLLAVLIKQYGTEFFDWDPLVLAQEIKTDYGVYLPSWNNDKIQAGITLLTTDMFFRDLQAFINICNVMSNSWMEVDQLFPADIDECSWALTETKLILGTDYKPNFDSDITRYVGVLLAQEGLDHAPSILDFADIPEHPEASVEDSVLYRTSLSLQKDRKQEIEDRINNRLEELFLQLKQLPIKDKDDSFIDRILTKLQTV